MTAYMTQFGKSSFILKPAGFRFAGKPLNPETVVESGAPLPIPLPIPVSIPILWDFVQTYGNRLMALKTYMVDDNYIVLRGENLKTQRFPGASKITLDAGFVVVPCPAKKYKGAVLIQHPTKTTKYISRRNGYFYMINVDFSDADALAAACFYPVAAQCGAESNFSLRCAISDNANIPQYFAISAGVAVVLNEDSTPAVKAATCLSAKEIASYKTANIANIRNLYIMTDIYGTLYMQYPEKQLDQPEFTYIVNPTAIKKTVNLISARTRKLLMVQSDNKVLANGSSTTQHETQFTLQALGGDDYFILDYQGRYLVSDAQNLLSFQPDTILIQAEIRDPTTGKITQLAMYSPPLENTKHFKIQMAYNIL
jgi:hypothetical protein